MLRLDPVTLGLGCAVVLAACGDAESSATPASLNVECAAVADIPDNAWVCPQPRSLRCDELDVATLYVPEGNALACEQETIMLVDDSPLGPGVHRVEVMSDNGEICAAELTVIDETPPHLESHTIHLWPPNHQLVWIDLDRCVTAIDDCGGPLRHEVLWISSDEPINDTGDGNHEPDIVADDCEHVALRAERSGPADGRVYTLGVRVSDDSGNSALAECQVVVDHDQGNHSAIDSGPVYRVAFDGTANMPNCGIAVSQTP